MSIDIILILISVLLSVYGSYNYIRDTIKGGTQPNRVSFAMWTVAPLIGVGGAISAGADIMTTARILMAGLMPLAILVASFYSKSGYWKLGRFDYSCGLFSLVAIFFWLVIDLPVYAVLLAAIADFFAAIPTIKKSWTNPETESGIVYVASLLSVIVILPTIKVYDIQNSAFQIYLLVVNVILIFVIYRKKFFKN